ncbi:hypothetical protein LUX12_18270 [Streptomyces somaliensis]|uniref:hypothetical protein n=1 Tax=Streptomyces somaliensis TaxID=78355 RepID=UPI0020CE1B1E|nr:hypothetical protein [Streptomyces somaliensis]MCP9946305.1 hypothetical protein [Streptomyces somaliensis]MCP9960542.1 hypothetical protein [Streptomyces somaliensis]MCP9973321.1 hypothetical protein [Streptomyces somaliensis]
MAGRENAAADRPRGKAGTALKRFVPAAPAHRGAGSEPRLRPVGTTKAPGVLPVHRPGPGPVAPADGLLSVRTDGPDDSGFTPVTPAAPG